MEPEQQNLTTRTDQAIGTDHCNVKITWSSGVFCHKSCLNCWHAFHKGQISIIIGQFKAGCVSVVSTLYQQWHEYIVVLLMLQSTESDECHTAARFCQRTLL